MSICGWIDFAGGCSWVNVKIANFAALSSKTYVPSFLMLPMGHLFFGPDKMAPILLKMHLAVLTTASEKLNSSSVVQWSFCATNLDLSSRLRKDWESKSPVATAIIFWHCRIRYWRGAGRSAIAVEENDQWVLSVLLLWLITYPIELDNVSRSSFFSCSRKLIISPPHETVKSSKVEVLITIYWLGNLSLVLGKAEYPELISIPLLRPPLLKYRLEISELYYLKKSFVKILGPGLSPKQRHRNW